MHISIIVVTYNSAAYIVGCLEAILAQVTLDDEVIVVDNSSTDATQALVMGYSPRVRLLIQANSGYAGGNNYGATMAQGRYLVFLNPDTIILSGTIAALVEPLITQAVLTTACLVHMKQPDQINACGNAVHYSGLAYCRSEGGPLSNHQASCEVAAVSGAAFALERGLFWVLGGFDPTFFMYVEDTDLSWRARAAGYRCLYVPSAVVLHDYTPSYNPSKAFYLDRNRHFMLLKNLRWTSYLRLLPSLLVAEGMTASFWLIKGPRYWWIKPRVYAALWRERANWLGARAATQRLRCCTDPDILADCSPELAFKHVMRPALARLASWLIQPLAGLAYGIGFPRAAFKTFLRRQTRQHHVL